MKNVSGNHGSGSVVVGVGSLAAVAAAATTAVAAVMSAAVQRRLW